VKDKRYELKHFLIVGFLLIYFSHGIVYIWDNEGPSGSCPKILPKFPIQKLELEGGS
jgi:hypothetical protein